jgi:DNA repair protein RecO (recombination protein O)
MESATALVLRVVPWSETSFVVTLFTREVGKVRAVAKGGRRPKGPFESALDVLALCRIVFLRKSSEALDVLTEAKLLRRFRVQGRSLAGLYAGYYVAELLSELTDDYDPHPELFDAANETLAALPAEAAVARRLLRFELTALRSLGYLPSLSQCSECGRPLEAAPRITFSPMAGGLLCPACRAGKRQLIALSSAAWQALRVLSDPDDAWQQLEMEKSTKSELRSVMNHYIAGLLHRKLQLHDYLAGLP